MEIVAILNHKGGVGKTTFTGSVGQALALSGFKVLLIDNDSQHNLSSMLGVNSMKPTIEDVYRAKYKQATTIFIRSIRKTEITNLHIITASSTLSEKAVPSNSFLKKIITECKLYNYYDYVLIDNAPGMDLLQTVAINASDTIFVPTELKQFAVDGIVEMESTLNNRLSPKRSITKIIPNFFRGLKREKVFITVLNDLFPGKVTKTAIPMDQVFDELITENKILFIHRLYSRGAAFYLKIMHELFNLDENEVWDRMVEKRQERFSEEARIRYKKRQQKMEQLND